MRGPSPSARLGMTPFFGLARSNGLVWRMSSGGSRSAPRDLTCQTALSRNMMRTMTDALDLRGSEKALEGSLAVCAARDDDATENGHASRQVLRSTESSRRQYPTPIVKHFRRSVPSLEFTISLELGAWRLGFGAFEAVPRRLATRDHDLLRDHNDKIPDGFLLLNRERTPFAREPEGAG